MNPLQNIRIKNKIVIIIVIIGTLSTVAGNVFNYLYEVQKTKEQLILNTTLLGKLIGEYCGLPLEFNYPDNAADALEKLRSIPDIQDGILFTLNDSIFASYHRTTNAMPRIPDGLREQGSMFEGNFVHVMLPVNFRGKHYGTIYLRSFIKWKDVMVRQFTVTCAVIGIVMVIIFGLASLLQRNISVPIIELTNKMNTVARNKDYSVQFHTGGRDEIGELHRGFNSMLIEIQKREADIKTTLESLRSSEEQFRATFDQAAVGIAHIAPNGQWLRVNNRLCDIVGFTRDELLQKTFQDITHPDDVATDVENVARLVTNNIATFSREKRYIRKDASEVWVNVTVSLLRETDGSPKYLIAVSEDITDRKQSEETQKILETHLFRAQRTESIGTLAAGIAHDFNNILNVIMGNADLLSRMPENTEKMQRRFDSIAKAADRGSNVVRQLLTFARKADIQYLPVNVNDIIIELSKLLDETFPKTIEIATRLATDLPLVLGDSTQIHQVLLNLSVNARDAMPAGGTITITTTRVSGESIAARYTAAEHKPYILIVFNDTGSGMDEATQLRVFDPFFTTKEKGKGTGLGLAVAVGIIETHRGFIDVKSEIGKGTEFNIYVPVIDRATAVAAIPLATTARTSGGSETILLIEDEQMIKEMIVPVLRDNGYTVLTASDGEEGIEMFKHHLNEIALVLSDYGLPKFDGEEVFKRIRLLDNSVLFVILTGFMGPEKRSELASIGVATTISKPYKPTDLLIMIRELLDRNSS